MNSSSILERTRQFTTCNELLIRGMLDQAQAFGRLEQQIYENRTLIDFVGSFYNDKKPE